MNCSLVTIQKCGILKYAAIYNYQQQITITYNRLFIAIHNHPHMAISSLRVDVCILC